MIVGAVHAHISAGPAFTYDDIPSLEAKSGSTSLTPLTGNAIPTTVANMLTTLQATFGQMAGQLGKGFHWFAFDAGSLHACNEGVLSIPLANETYTWETPIPGCSKK